MSFANWCFQMHVQHLGPMISRNYELIVYLIMIYVYTMLYNTSNSGLWNHKKVIIAMYKDSESHKKSSINTKKGALIGLTNYIHDHH